MRRQHWFSGHVKIRLLSHRIIEPALFSRRWPRVQIAGAELLWLVVKRNCTKPMGK
jgi:hypothetical protein